MVHELSFINYMGEDGKTSLVVHLAATPAEAAKAALLVDLEHVFDSPDGRPVGIFNAIRSNLGIEVPKMRMQFGFNLIMNQGKGGE